MNPKILDVGQLTIESDDQIGIEESRLYIKVYDHRAITIGVLGGDQGGDSDVILRASDCRKLIHLLEEALSKVKSAE
jgi:hypothetical protein